MSSVLLICEGGERTEGGNEDISLGRNKLTLSQNLDDLSMEFCLRPWLCYTDLQCQIFLKM